MTAEPLEPVETVTQQLDVLKLSPADAWNKAVVNKFLSKDGDQLRGYIGWWRYFNPDGAEDANVKSCLSCIRTYACVTEDETMVVKFRNFHEEMPGTGEPVQRGDGVWESAFGRRFTDPYFQCNMTLTEAERQQGLPACMFWRSIPLHADVVTRVCPALPPHPLAGGELLAAYPSWSPSALASHSVWAFEAFLGDTKHRWSMGPLYNVQTLQLLSHFFIQETGTFVDPSKPVRFSEHWSDESPRDKLDADVDTWLDAGSWKGTLTEAIWDDDGVCMRLEPRRAVWVPPSRPDHKLFLYQDAMYAQYPKQLPLVDGTVEPTFQNSIRFEVGGMMRDRQEFQRITISYSVAGYLERIGWEVYKPPHTSRTSSANL